MAALKSTKSKAYVSQAPSTTYTALTAKDAHYTESKINTPPKNMPEGMGDQPLNPKTTTRPRSKIASKDQKPVMPIRLPYGRAGLRAQGYGRIIETEGNNGNPRAAMGNLKRGRESPKVPYWLVDLEDEHLTGIMSIKKLFESEKDDQTVLEKLIKIMEKFGSSIRIPTKEICQILKLTPKSVNGNFSFSHFIFILGNPAYAKKQVNYTPNKYTQLDCTNLPSSSSGPGKSQGSSNDKTRNDAGAGDGKRQDEKTVKLERKKSVVQGSSSSSAMREEIFYTGLLLFEMQDTLKGVERLYFNDSVIPIENRSESVQKKRGFGTADKGYKKFGEAEWDKPPPPLPKISPYLSPTAFVTNRWAVRRPNADEQGRRRTLATLQPMHLIIEPPKENTRDPIRITENRMRIREALMYLAAKGDCVALLPEVHYVIHLSDTFVDKLEEVSTRATYTPPMKKVYHSNDVDWIAREIKSIYTPHGLPNYINRLQHLIKYSDGIKLRKICNYIRANQWAYVCNKKLEFREKAWEKMRIDYMPEGMLKTSFINSFVTYLPYISHLPIVQQKDPNP